MEEVPCQLLVAITELVFATYSGGSSLSTVTQNLTELYADVPVDGKVFTEADMNAGDKFIFNFNSVTLSDGRTLAPAANTVVEFLCVSELEGSFTTSTRGWCGIVQTGTADWTQVADGIYETYDFTYGAYLACYSWTGIPEGSLQIKDTCGKLEPIGASQWGEIYWFNNVTVSGIDLIIDWENDYGEAGVSTLTRTDGNNWPDNLRN